MYRRILMKRNPNRCIVTFWWSEIQIDVSSHFYEAKFKSMYRRILMKRNSNRSPYWDWAKLSIVALWWSEIQIDVSSHFDEAKSKSMYRRILMKRNLNRCIVAFWWSEIQIDRRIEIERNSSRSLHCDWAKYKSMYHRILMAFIFREVEVHWIVMNLVIVISEVPWWRKWLCSIFPGYNRQRILLDPVSKPKVTPMSRTEDELSLAIRVKMSMSNLAN